MLSKADLKYAVKGFFTRHERLFPLLFVANRKHFQNVAGRKTDLVIEAFPRSANTFFEVQLRMRLDGGGKDIAISHHRHSAAQFKRARRYGIPGITIVRDPSKAIDSLRKYSGESFDLRIALLEYIRFYEIVLEEINNGGKILIFRFEDVTNCIEGCMRSVQDKLSIAGFSGVDGAIDDDKYVQYMDEISKKRGKSGVDGIHYLKDKPVFDSRSSKGEVEPPLGGDGGLYAELFQKANQVCEEARSKAEKCH